MTARIITGDCREVLATMAANSIDACVTDPPLSGGPDKDCAVAMMGDIGGLVTGRAKRNQIVEVMGFGLGGAVLQRTDVMDVQPTSNLSRRDAAALAGISVTLQGNSSLPVPIRAIDDPFRTVGLLHVPTFHTAKDTVWANFITAMKIFRRAANNARIFPAGASSLTRTFSATPSLTSRVEANGADGATDFTSKGLTTRHALAWLRTESSIRTPGRHIKHCATHLAGSHPAALPALHGAVMFGAFLNKVHLFIERLTATAAYHIHMRIIPYMQWLVRLITPKGGTVLDCFCGSGTTGIAADREGMHFIGIEQDESYAEIARRRFIGDCPLFAEVMTT